MDTSELSMDKMPSSPDRVVEAELRLPKAEDIRLPEVNLEPARRVVKEVLLTSIGIGVLLVRGVKKAVKAAHDAGAEAATEPGPVTSALVGWLDAKPAEKAKLTRRVPVLPIENYDTLELGELLDHLGDLTEAEMTVVLAYERAHRNRNEVVTALDGRLGGRFAQ